MSNIPTYANNPRLKEMVKRYHKAGYALTPLKEKAPFLRGWQNTKWQPEINHSLFDACSSVGFVLPEDVLVIDVDNHNNTFGDESLKKMTEHYGINFEKLSGFVVKTAGGGRHIYLRLPKGIFQISERLSGFPGIEFKPAGRQVVIPSSILPDGREYKLHPIYCDLENIGLVPQKLLSDLTKKIDTKKQNAKICTSNNNTFYTDHPSDIERFESYLDGISLITYEGDRGNTIYKIACQANNLGISPKTALLILSEWQKISFVPPLHSDELNHHVKSGYKYSQEGTGTKSVTEMEWEEPVLFNQYNLPEISSELLPPILKEFSQELSAWIETPEGMTVLAILSVLATILQDKIEVSPRENDRYKETANIYTMTTLIPGNRKSAVFNYCTSPILAWEGEQKSILEPEIKRQKSRFDSETKIIEGLRTKLKNPQENTLSLMKEIDDRVLALKEPQSLPKLFVNDTTPESLISLLVEQNDRMAILSDEGGIIETISGLYSGGNSNIDVILKGFDKGHLRKRRADREYNLRPLLTINLVVQPSIVQNMSTKKSLCGNGLFERFLYYSPKSKLGYRTHNTTPISEEIFSSYEQLMKRLLDLPYNEVPKLLILDEEARPAWHNFQKEIEIELRPNGKLSVCPGWGGKICGYALRIAALFHAVEFGLEKTAINKPTIERSIMICKLLAHHAVAIFGGMNTNQDLRDAENILHRIQSEGLSCFTKAEMTKKMQNRINFKAKRLDELLTILAERNIISPPERIGNKTKRYMVNPAILNQNSNIQDQENQENK